MGGNPFGPAGTGKTESVKALGAQLGRFVLVFNCDESFDYSAMGRLFAGLCQVGCFFFLFPAGGHLFETFSLVNNVSLRCGTTTLAFVISFAAALTRWEWTIFGVG